MRQRHPHSTRPAPLFPVTTLFRSRLVLAVLLERGAAPYAALVLRVLPEVVVVLAALADVGDLGVGIEHGEDVGFELVEARRAGQFGFGAGVLFAHPGQLPVAGDVLRSEEHTSELQSLMRISYAVFCLKKKTNRQHSGNRITTS